MKAPITYIEKFVPNPDEAFARLRDELEWERRSDAPRSEYYCNDTPKPYVYGVGRGRRQYEPRPYHEVILSIRKAIEERFATKLDVCFLNMYLNQSDQLGWHADDSPEMDDARPIAVVSLGVERDIMFRPVDRAVEVERLRLGHGQPLPHAARHAGSVAAPDPQGFFPVRGPHQPDLSRLRPVKIVIDTKRDLRRLARTLHAASWMHSSPWEELEPYDREEFRAAARRLMHALKEFDGHPRKP